MLDVFSLVKNPNFLESVLICMNCLFEFSFCRY